MHLQILYSNPVLFCHGLNYSKLAYISGLSKVHVGMDLLESVRRFFVMMSNFCIACR
jgi:hypothetical protein